jgi:hypothetical protein
VGRGVGVLVGVTVGVAVRVAVAVATTVGVGEGVGVAVAVIVAVTVGVAVGMAVAVARATAENTIEGSPSTTVAVCSAGTKLYAADVGTTRTNEPSLIKPEVNSPPALVNAVVAVPSADTTTGTPATGV